MAISTYKLICESPEEHAPVETCWTESSLNQPRILYLTGPYMGGGVVNKNKRLYPIEEMRTEVNNFIETKVKKKISCGELNHPNHAQIDLQNAAHLITEMWEDNDVWYGKSKVLIGTPKGDLLRALINNGVAIGMSSRCLGQLSESNEGYSTVHNMKMITVDAVADPSFDKAFVKGVLESKQYIVESNGEYRECYDKLENHLNDLPRGKQNAHIVKALKEFLAGFNTKN